MHRRGAMRRWCAALASSLAASLAISTSVRADCPADLDNNQIVDGGDLGILLLNWGTAGAGDLNGDGVVTGGDMGIMLIAWGNCPPAEPVVTITLGATQATITEGGSVGFATIVAVEGVGAEPVVVSLSLVSSSASVDVATDLPAEGFAFAADGIAVFNTLLSSSTLGGSSIEITATPSEGSPVATTLPVQVVPVSGVPVLAPMSAMPAAVNPGTTGAVVFTLGLSGTTAPPASFRLVEVSKTGDPIADVATLLDDGASPDVVAGDGVYSASLAITPGKGEERRRYKACETGLACGSGLESPALSVEFTSFPVGTVGGDPDSIVTLADGTQIYDDQVLMIFVEGTTEARITEVVDSVGGTILGSIPASNAYQVGIPGDGTGDAVHAVIAQMKTVVDIDIVEPVFPSLAAELVPNDPLWASQLGVAAIRATEAWTVATGSVAIAIVDSGVDATHPELAGKVVVLPGSDVLDGDDDPSDTSGHGTRMAGAAAAIGNNGIGLAGLAWQSPVIAVRAFGAGGSDVTLASGIVFAASNGARVICVSGTLREASAILTEAVAFAQERGCLVVAAAGNRGSGESVETYPCALSGVLCVGAIANDGTALDGTNVGSWVSLAAPGEAVPVLENGGGYGTATGTSPATAIVAGVAALVWSTDPTLEADEVRSRLVAGASPIEGAPGLGAGRVDAFESTFDGSFELGGLESWQRQGTVSVITSLGPLLPTDGTHMAYLSTGPAASQTAATLRRDFVVQPGVTEFGISFDYDFISEEWPEYVGSQFDDELRIVLVEPDGTEVLLAVETINDSLYFPIEGINFPGGDQTVGHTGWKTATAVVPITKGPGSYAVRIEDAGDNLYDSVVLLDRIRLVGDPNAVFCGAAAAGPCCVARKEPFCVDPACCNAVCTFDPTCCQVAWDARCVEIAVAVCDGLCGPPPSEICANGFDDDFDGLTDCEDPDCVGSPNCGNGPGEVCGNGQDDDGDGLVDCDDPDCADFQQCGDSFCGDPEADSCCFAHPMPFCADESCCETVCAVDPFCCTTAWDDLCADEAAELCGTLCKPTIDEICDNGIDDDGDGLVDCLDPECAAFPGCGPAGIANDECIDAIPLVEGDNDLDTIGATTGSEILPEACAKYGSNVIHRDVWFTFTATCSGEVTMSFCAQNGGTADFDTRLAVWSGTCGALEIVACDDDSCQQFRSRVVFDAVCGETYFVQVGSFAANQVGSARLSVECAGSPCGE